MKYDKFDKRFEVFTLKLNCNTTIVYDRQQKKVVNLNDNEMAVLKSTFDDADTQSISKKLSCTKERVIKTIDKLKLAGLLPNEKKYETGLFPPLLTFPFSSL